MLGYIRTYSNCTTSVPVQCVSSVFTLLLASFWSPQSNLLHNVALHRTAVQSSESSDLGAAANAVDGNRNARFQSGSCTQTEEESDPWWRVDLGSVNSITAVIITNRNEQENLLNGAEIWIGKSVETNDIKNRCAVISHIPKGRAFYFSCSPAEGRYVTVLLRGSKKVLTLCEVEVFVANYARPLPNVALQGEAAQSSTLSFAAASKAIDGRRNSFYSHGSCSHTAVGETNPWWRLDLRQTFVIISIKVTNRGDCCAERLDGAEILVGDSLQNNGNDNPRCATISHIAAGKTSTYQCDGGSMVGRFVNVMIPGKSKTLTLCEVEVYAVPAGKALRS
uniref:Si:ch211-215k15.4 n=1 Tax=Stegastes partitus TaxID=144197 RepID=A0A3B4ZCG5_9TELE